jgi:hypothetical protein
MVGLRCFVLASRRYFCGGCRLPPGWLNVSSYMHHARLHIFGTVLDWIFQIWHSSLKRRTFLLTGSALVPNELSAATSANKFRHTCFSINFLVWRTWKLLNRLALSHSNYIHTGEKWVGTNVAPFAQRASHRRILFLRRLLKNDPSTALHWNSKRSNIFDGSASHTVFPSPWQTSILYAVS